MTSAKEFVEWANEQMERARKEKGDEYAKAMKTELRWRQLRSAIFDQLYMILEQRQIARLQESITRRRREFKETREVLNLLGADYPVNDFTKMAREFMASDEAQYLPGDPRGLELDRAFDDWIKNRDKGEDTDE